MLRMCSREQLGKDLKRAVRDLICDENFDAGIAPCLRLVILVLLAPAGGIAAYWLEPKNMQKHMRRPQSPECRHGKQVWSGPRMS